jgi:hypothetical protein
MDDAGFINDIKNIIHRAIMGDNRDVILIISICAEAAVCIWDNVVTPPGCFWLQLRISYYGDVCIAFF